MVTTIIGFSGRPVIGATGLKPPIVRQDADGHCSVFRNGSFGDRWSKAELEGHVANGLASMCPGLGGHADGVTILYAHTEFVAPSALSFGASSPPLVLSVPAELTLVPRLESYVSAMTTGAAEEILRDWASSLLLAAREALREGDGDLALAESLRARFALAMLSGDADRHSRMDAFAIGLIGLMLAGKDNSMLRLDASIDFSMEEIDRRVKELLPPPPLEVEPRRVCLDTPELEHRFWKDAA